MWTFLNRNFACMKRNIECTKVGCLEPVIELAWNSMLNPNGASCSLTSLPSVPHLLCAVCMRSIVWWPGAMLCTCSSCVFRKRKQENPLVASLDDTLRCRFRKMQSVVAHACDPVTPEAEMRGHHKLLYATIPDQKDPTADYQAWCFWQILHRLS